VWRHKRWTLLQGCVTEVEFILLRHVPINDISTVPMFSCAPWFKRVCMWLVQQILFNYSSCHGKENTRTEPPAAYCCHANILRRLDVRLGLQLQTRNL